MEEVRKRKFYEADDSKPQWYFCYFVIATGKIILAKSEP